jgi:hypothetical protein
MKDLGRRILSRVGGHPAPADAAPSTAPQPCDHDSPAYRLRLRLACQSEEHGPSTTDFDGVRYQFFFLCGCFKSGTNWLGALLNLHPRVLIRGEFHFQELALGNEHFTAPRWFVAHKPWIKPYADESLRATVRTMMLASTRDKPGARWLGDRTPRRLEALLPGAPHVHVYRDGRDVLVSWAFHWLRTGRPGLALPGFEELTLRSAEEFKREPEAFLGNPARGLLADDEWVRHACREWASRARHDAAAAARLPAEGTPVLSVRYEDLHERFEEVRTALYRFLDLDPAEALPPSEETRTLPGFKAESPGSKHRKGAVGDWRNYFDERLTRLFKQEAGPELETLGYAPAGGW